MTSTRPPVVVLALVAEHAAERRRWEDRLRPEERALLGPSMTPKRRAELVAGRSAAKHAVAVLTGAPADGFAVLRQGNGKTGRPRVHGASGTALAVEVSITHADGIAAAAASEQRIGADLVTIEIREPGFEREAFVAEELEAWARWLGCGARADLSSAVAFAAKEAAAKWLGTGLTISLHDFAVAPAEPGRVSARDGDLATFDAMLGCVDADWRLGWIAARARFLGVTLNARRSPAALLLAAWVFDVGHQVLFVLSS